MWGCKGREKNKKRNRTAADILEALNTPLVPSFIIVLKSFKKICGGLCPLILPPHDPRMRNC